VAPAQWRVGGRGEFGVLLFFLFVLSLYYNYFYYFFDLYLHPVEQKKSSVRHKQDLNQKNKPKTKSPKKF